MRYTACRAAPWWARSPQFFAVKAADIALKPKNLDFEQAASVPARGPDHLPGVQRAHGPAIRREHPSSRQARAASATFAIQLAKIMGAYVATTASEKGRALVERLGADEVIDYRTTDFWKVLHGYDCLYDVFGRQEPGRGVQNPAARRGASCR